MVDVPTQFKFEHLLSHTFPGFFSALTVFMFIDYISPKDLTMFVISLGIDGLIGFSGFVLLVGSIFGIIIDGIHHSIIEDYLFDDPQREDYKNIKELKKYCLDKCAEDVDPETVTRHFFFKKLDGTAINQYLVEEFYSYSEFYSNVFISLFIFSFVFPFYITETLEVPKLTSFIIAVGSLSIAFLCLYNSYETYKRYNKALFSAIRGYIDIETITGTVELSRTATQKGSSEDISREYNADATSIAIDAQPKKDQGKEPATADKKNTTTNPSKKTTKTTFPGNESNATVKITLSSK